MKESSFRSAEQLAMSRHVGIGLGVVACSPGSKHVSLVDTKHWLSRFQLRTARIDDIMASTYGESESIAAAAALI